MTKARAPEPARLLAYHVLREVTEEGAFSNQSLSQHLLLTDLNQQSRAFATALVYGTLSRLSAIDYQLRKYLEKPLESYDPEVIACLRLGAWQIFYSYSVPKAAAVDESVKLCRHIRKSSASSLVNAVLRRLPQGEPEFPKAQLGVSLGLGNELFGLFKSWFGEKEALEIARACLKEEKAITLRPNRRKGGQAACLRSLKSQGCDVREGFMLPESISLIRSPLRIDELEAYKQGLFMVQDEAAQLCGALAPLRRAQLILDLCAAPGGKTCDLAERMPETAEIWGFDRSEERLQRARENAERLGLKIHFEVLDSSAVDLSQELRQILSQAALADFVLCDVPCSGLGLLGRKPEIRQRISYEDLKRFPPIQMQILERGAELVKPGAYLMYATCTLNPAENEELVRAFLASAQGQSYRSVLRRQNIPAGVLRLLEEDSASCELLNEGFLSLRPDLLPCDGFFIALLQRIK